MKYFKGLTETCPEEVIKAEKEACQDPSAGYIYTPDPSGFRTGQGL